MQIRQQSAARLFLAPFFAGRQAAFGPGGSRFLRRPAMAGSASLGGSASGAGHLAAPHR
jgi:hypothetical protein